MAHNWNLDVANPNRSWSTNTISSWEEPHFPFQIYPSNPGSSLHLIWFNIIQYHIISFSIKTEWCSPWTFNMFNESPFVGHAFSFSLHVIRDLPDHVPTCTSDMSRLCQNMCHMKFCHSERRKMCQKLSEDLPQNICQKLCQDKWQHICEELQEHMPDFVSENISHISIIYIYKWFVYIYICMYTIVQV